MNVSILASILDVDPLAVSWLFVAFGIFGWGRTPGPDTPLDAEEVAATLRLGISDLCDADRRSDGWSRVDPNIALDDVMLAGQIAEALSERVKSR